MRRRVDDKRLVGDVTHAPSYTPLHGRRDVGFRLEAHCLHPAAVLHAAPPDLFHGCYRRLGHARCAAGVCCEATPRLGIGKAARGGDAVVEDVGGDGGVAGAVDPATVGRAGARVDLARGARDQILRREDLACRWQPIAVAREAIVERKCSGRCELNEGKWQGEREGDRRKGEGGKGGCKDGTS